MAEDKWEQTRGWGGVLGLMVFRVPSPKLPLTEQSLVRERTKKVAPWVGENFHGGPNTVQTPPQGEGAYTLLPHAARHCVGKTRGNPMFNR